MVSSTVSLWHLSLSCGADAGMCTVNKTQRRTTWSLFLPESVSTQSSAVCTDLARRV